MWLGRLIYLHGFHASYLDRDYDISGFEDTTRLFNGYSTFTLQISSPGAAHEFGVEHLFRLLPHRSPNKLLYLAQTVTYIKDAYL